MTTRGWLTASTAERTRELVRAINTVAIDSKLRLAGTPEPDVAAVESARERLLEFVRRLSTLIAEAQKDNRPVVGADPQLSRMVRGLVSPTGSAQVPRVSPASVIELQSLLETPSQRVDLERLVVDLRALRQLLEHYSQREPRVR